MTPAISRPNGARTSTDTNPPRSGRGGGNAAPRGASLSAVTLPTPLLGPAYLYVIAGKPVSGKNHNEIAINRATGSRYIRPGKTARLWQFDAVEQLAHQRGLRRPLAGPVHVQYVAYQAWDACDIDNMESALFDALTKARVIVDDKQIQGHAGWKLVDADRPRFEVVVRAILGAGG